MAHKTHVRPVSKTLPIFLEAVSIQATNNRGRNYTRVEDMMVSKAFIEASEDPRVGNSQTGTIFKATVFEIYNRRRLEQCAMDVEQYQNSSKGLEQAMMEINGGFNSPTQYPEHNVTSVTERWKRYISPRVSKFMGIEATSPRESGSNDEGLYRLCSEHYIRRYSLGSFDDLKMV